MRAGQRLSYASSNHGDIFHQLFTSLHARAFVCIPKYNRSANGYEISFNIYSTMTSTAQLRFIGVAFPKW